MAKPNQTIFLIGDAILDNFYQLDDKKQDLKQDLVDLGFNVNNYAIDQTRVEDVVNGVLPTVVIGSNTRSYAYQTDHDGKVYPLKLLAQKSTTNKHFQSVYAGIKSQQVDENIVVISLGGNNLNNGFMKIAFGVDFFINSVVTPIFIKTYENVIITACRNSDKLILISPHLPYLGPGSKYTMYEALAIPLMEKWFVFLNDLGKKYNIPILDMRRTLNTKNRTHYGLLDTHPSNLSSKCLAQCIKTISNNYKGYHIYYAPNCDGSKLVTE
jgi:hypothetical protein